MLFLRWLCVLSAVSMAGSAVGQTTVTFESLSDATVVTNQFAGVAFGFAGAAGNPTVGQTGAGPGQVGLTSSGTRFLKGPPDSGSPCAAMRMTFTALQREVSFNIGTGQTLATPPPLATDGQIVTVIVYDATGTVLATLSRSVTIRAVDSGAIDLPITISSTTRNIRRVEISSRDNGGVLCRTPVIDDLTFCDVLDASDPVASITAPADLSCICPGTALLVSGTIGAGACGAYSSDRMEYRSISAPDWTIAEGPYTSLPGSGDDFTGTLYAWQIPSTLATGYYYFRSVVENAAGRSSSDVVLLYLDRTAPTVVHDSPVSGGLVRANVCLLGEVSDGPCGAAYTAEYRVAGVGAFMSIPTAGAPWPRLAQWNTVSLADGAYDLRFTTTDSCGNVGVTTKALTVDNTRPVARIDTPVACGTVAGLVTVRGQATDAHLSGWSLQYTGGDLSGWTTISTGTSAISSGGVLGVWNTAGLRRCAYTLRLLASDAADNNCGSGGNVGEYLVSVEAGCDADFNRSGSVSVQDIFDFLSAYFAGCP